MLARQQGIRWSSPSLLYQPATNLQLGARYIRSLLDQWNGRWEQTLAAYNAGPSRVKEWMSWGNYREPSEFVESIPFTETREYVQAVMRNAAVYREVYGPAPEVHEEETGAAPLVTAVETGHAAPIRKAAAPATVSRSRVKSRSKGKTRTAVRVSTAKRKHRA